jgi:hypothetical protein
MIGDADYIWIATEARRALSLGERKGFILKILMFCATYAASTIFIKA